MRILFYFGVFARVGGIEEFTCDLAMALTKAGIDVRIVCASPSQIALKRLVTAGVKVMRVPVSKGCRWNIPDYALLPFALWAMRDVDVVIHQKPFKRSFYRFFPEGPNHVCITAYRPLEQFPERSGRAHFFSLFDSVFTQTQEFADDIEEIGLNIPVEVLPYIPPYTEHEAAEQNASPNVLRIGMMGRLEPQKNPLYALEIVRHIAENLGEEVRVVFNIYGSGTLEQEMRAESAAQEVNASYHGAYTRADISGITEENDLFIISSDSEGQCIVALEILAGGRPLFATPVGALPHILSKAERGDFLPFNDASMAAKTVTQWWAEYDHDRVSIRQSYLEDYDRVRIEQDYVNKLRNLRSL